MGNDRTDASRVRDLLQWVRVQEHEVGEFVFRHRSEFVGALEESGRIERGGLQRLKGGSPASTSNCNSSWRPNPRKAHGVAVSDPASSGSPTSAIKPTISFSRSYCLCRTPHCSSVIGKPNGRPPVQRHEVRRARIACRMACCTASHQVVGSYSLQSGREVDR